MLGRLTLHHLLMYACIQVRKTPNGLARPIGHGHGRGGGRRGGPVCVMLMPSLPPLPTLPTSREARLERQIYDDSCVCTDVCLDV